MRRALEHICVINILVAVMPVRKQGPGTLGFIAQQGGKENRVKVKGSRCGQCEHKAAQVVGGGLTPCGVNAIVVR